MPLKVQVLLFAKAREDAGAERLTWELPDGATLAALRRGLCERYGQAFAGYGFAVNETWQTDDTGLQAGDAIAVLPPISGGEAPLITEGPLDPATLTREVLHPGAGAVVLFLGTVRSSFEGRPSVAVEYQGYRSMAEKELRWILDRAKSLGEDIQVAATHRLGVLPVGEASVVIAASAPHRDLAFAACRAVIEDIKTRLPVWKKELGPEGSTRWHDA